MYCKYNPLNIFLYGGSAQLLNRLQIDINNLNNRLATLTNRRNNYEAALNRVHEILENLDVDQLTQNILQELDHNFNIRNLVNDLIRPTPEDIINRLQLSINGLNYNINRINLQLYNTQNRLDRSNAFNQTTFAQDLPDEVVARIMRQTQRGGGFTDEFKRSIYGRLGPDNRTLPISLRLNIPTNISNPVLAHIVEKEGGIDSITSMSQSMNKELRTTGTEIMALIDDDFAMQEDNEINRLMYKANPNIEGPSQIITGLDANLTLEVPYKVLKCAEHDPDNVFLIKGHGGIIPGSFILPDDVKLITMIDLGEKLDDNIASNTCNHIQGIYNQHNSTLFPDNDMDKTQITERQRDMIDLARKGELVPPHVGLGRYPIKLRFKLNTPGDEVNNQIISFKQGCDIPGFCGITVIKPSATANRRLLAVDCNKHTEHVNFDNTGIGNITLEDIIKINGPGTYISCTCRSFYYKGKVEEEELSRNLSAKTERFGPTSL